MERSVYHRPSLRRATSETKMNALRASDMRDRIGLLLKSAQGEALKNLFSEFNQASFKEGFKALDGTKARGIDNVSKKDYEKNLDSNIEKLILKVHNQSYVPKPKREVLIPKTDGSKRPIAIACLEDKLVERVTANLLTCIYEPIFSINSFGFRPGLSCHRAIKQTFEILDSKKGYDFVVEIDLAKFFNTVNHKLLMKMIKRKIASKKLLSLIHRQLTAKIENEEGELTEPEVGTPQGGIVSPLLANIFLHYVIDEWFNENYHQKAKMVRYADDCIFMFKNQSEAHSFLKELRNRLSEYKLSLNEDKTKVINLQMNSFEVFDFLGFTFYRGKARKGRGRLLKIKTSHNKLTKSLTDFTEWIKKNRSAMSTGKIIDLINAKLRGHYNYFGFWCNRNNLSRFYFEVTKTMFKWLNRRSQRKSLDWDSFSKVITKHLHQPPEIINLKRLGRNPYAY